MKNLILGAAVAIFLGSTVIGGNACSTRNNLAVSQPDTLIINTTEIGKDIPGFKGPVPLEITLVDGKVSKIVALPNKETPGFFQRVVESGLLEVAVGMTAHEAAIHHYDAVSGATYSSRAVIDNIRAGLKSLEKEQ
ncbi:MAG: FMN-binding protein [Bacteroidales bacterium]|nr:FMN-binding protein [Bacteroidales bacterium]